MYEKLLKEAQDWIIEHRNEIVPYVYGEDEDYPTTMKKLMDAIMCANESDLERFVRHHAVPYDADYVIEARLERTPK